MESLLLLIVALIVIVVTLKLISLRGQSSDFPYVKNQVLFSPAERSFLGVLDLVVGEQYRIFGKVRIADVVSVSSTNNRRRWRQAFNRINAKHFDFVLCRKDDLTVVAVIELDDKSHLSQKRPQRDAFIAGLCQSIGLPLIQIPAQATYSTTDIQARLQTAIDATTASSNQPTATDPIVATPVTVSQTENGNRQRPATTEALSPTCPNCASTMILRTSKNGATAGQKFWGCSAYPRCRGIVPISDK